MLFCFEFSYVSDSHKHRGFFLSSSGNEEAFLFHSVNPEAGLFTFACPLDSDAVVCSPEESRGAVAVHPLGDARGDTQTVIVRDYAQDSLTD